MVTVTTKEFNANSQKYFSMAVNSEVCIRDDNYMFQLTGNRIEPDVILQPDDAFYRSITADELLKGIYEDIDEFFANNKEQ